MNSGLLDVQVSDTDAVGVVTARGEVDMGTRLVLQRALTDQLRRAAEAAGAMVVLDLSEVSFLDSSGLSVLLTAHQTADVALRLVVRTTAVRRLLEITGMDQVLDIHPSLDEALAV